MHRKQVLAEIHSTISMSEVRCLGFDEMLTRLETIWSDRQGSQIVYRLCEEEFSHNELVALGVSVVRLADAIDALPSQMKSSPDRAVRRILCTMPAEIAAPIAIPWVEHPRKFRRDLAYRILRDSGLTPASGKALYGAFERTGDQECLHLIARFPMALEGLDVSAILPLVEDDYWRMRLFQAALSQNPVAAVPLAELYPRECTNAIGRLKDISLLPIARQLFQARTSDLDYLSLYAWMLGQLQAEGDLKTLKSHIETMS